MKNLFHTVLFLLAMACASAASAHGASVGALRIEHPYAMPNPAAPQEWLVYFRGIKNEGSKPDRLLQASTAVAAEVVLLRDLPPQSPDKVFAVTSIELPPNSSTPMRHNLGEYRLLLKGLKKAVKEGERIELGLTFESAGTVQVQVYLQGAAEGAAPEHQH